MQVMFNWIHGLLDRICAVAGAIVFLQAPLFINQYTQQLFGRSEELRLHVHSMQKAAALSGKSLDQYIYKFVESGDVDYIRQGEVMASMVDRWHQVSDASAALNSSSLLSRPFVFLSHMNWDIAKSTWQNFSFGLPFNIEGIFYALIGLICGLLFYFFIHRLCAALWYAAGFSRKLKVTRPSRP